MSYRSEKIKPSGDKHEARKRPVAQTPSARKLSESTTMAIEVSPKIEESVQDIPQTLFVGDDTERRASWEAALLARWGRLHLLMTVVEPLLPADHPRLHLLHNALFSTYQDLKSVGVEPQRVPAA